MANVLRFLSGLGNAGAVANAHRACEERRLAEARVDALAARMRSMPSSPASVRQRTA